MLAELRSAARRVGDQRALRSLLIDCRRLLSERGEANSVAIAAGLVEHLAQLQPERQPSLFQRLARDFSPHPQAVLHSAHAYVEEPGADTLSALARASDRPTPTLPGRT